MANGFLMDSNFVTHNVVERITGGLIVTESDHTAIHKGYGYKGSFETGIMAFGTSKSWSFVTPVGSYVHFKNLRLSVLGASCKVEFLKDVAITVDTGTAVALMNQNLNSANVAGSTIKASPTYTGGTVVDSITVLMDSTNQFVGSGSSSGFPYEEIVLKPDEQYVIKVTNISPDKSITDAVVNFFFYEEPSGSF